MEENKDNIILKGGQQYNSVGDSPFSSRPFTKPPSEIDASKKRGCGICIISRGTVPLKWSMHLNRLKTFFPIGLYWKFIIVEGLSWAAARNECARKCRMNGFQWLFFIDDDVFLPDNGLVRLMKSGKDIISGVYWTKTADPEPVIFETMGEGPLYDFEADKVIPIEGSGAGCLLINMDVFDKFDEAGIPYFVENWVHTDKQGNQMKCPIGEDHYFFLKSREFGYQAYADTGVLCDHYDVKTKTFYPGEKIIRKICSTELKKQGRQDLVDEYINATDNPNKKTVMIYNDTVPFAGDEIERRGVGGSEHDIIHLAKELYRTNKFNVYVYCQCLREGMYDHVVYRDNKRIESEIKDIKPDYFISSRNLEPFFDDKLKPYVKKSIYWAHDLAGDACWNNWEQAEPNIDVVVALSEFHKQNIMKHWPNTDKKKIVIFRNGVDNARYGNKNAIKRVKGRCIYSSTPYRGLDILLSLWPKIKEQVPYADLQIFSSIKVYGEHFDDGPWENLYQLAKNLPGVDYHGTIKQDRLAVEQMKSQLLIYPTQFEETCCVTAMECQTAGTPIISSDKGALSEMVPEGCGVLLKGDARSKEYQQEFVDAVVHALKNEAEWDQMHQNCLKQDYSWVSITKGWVDMFIGSVDTTCKQECKWDYVEPSTEVVEEAQVDDIKQHGNVNTPDYWDKVYDTEIKQGLNREKPGHELLLKEFNGGKILDVGCGTGEFTRQIKQSFPTAEVWGSDFSLKAIDYCRQQDKTIYYANHPLLNHDYEKGYFDMITMNHIMEHLDEPEKIIHHAEKLLKPGGKLVLIIPINDNEWHQHLKIWYLNDIEHLLRQFDCEYTITHRKTNSIYSDGRRFEEAIVNISFISSNK